MPSTQLVPFTLIGLIVCLGCGGSQEPAKAPDEPAEPTPGDGAGGGDKAAGVMQPKWTMIDGVRDCTGQILKNYVCIPPERPAACTEKAWQELNALTGKEAVTHCALEADIMDCTTADAEDPDVRCFPKERPTACTDEKWGRVKDVKLVYACGAAG